MTESGAAMPCPKCHVPLGRREHGGFAAFVCGACLGVWLPKGQLERTVYAAARQHGAPLKALGLTASPPQPTSMRCPTCADVALDWLTLRGVRVERCARCLGIFLEPGEGEMITKRVLLAQRMYEVDYQEWVRAVEWAKQMRQIQIDGSV